MIERVHQRLCDWADEALGGYGSGGAGCVLGALVDNPVALTKLHRRKARVIKRDRSGNIVELHVGGLTAEGTQTRVNVSRQVLIDDAAMQVSEALRLLPDHLRDCVVTFYVRGDLQVRVKAQRLGVSVKTMYNRRDAAHVILDSVLYGADLPSVCESYPQVVGQN
ncbi:hypothetical protein GCM10027217_18360 [Pseudomaricurvus hydrocarbonicus]